MKDPCFINAYIIHRRYGGPEEGGWWYNEGYPLAYVDAAGMDDDTANRIFEIIDDAYKKRYPNGDYILTETYVQKHRPRHFPTVKPIYQ
jgi:hypothetical protein